MQPAGYKLKPIDSMRNCITYAARRDTSDNFVCGVEKSPGRIVADEIFPSGVEWPVLACFSEDSTHSVRNCRANEIDFTVVGMSSR